VTAVFADPSGIDPAVRRAALTLYAAHPDDREWMIARLPSDDRLELEKMLAELASLGMPRDPEMVRSALREPANGAPVTPSSTPHFPAFLLSAELDAMAELLRQETAMVSVFALALMPEGSASAVLGRLPPVLQRELQSLRGAMTGCDVPPRLGAALLEELRQRLPDPIPALSPWRAFLQHCVSVLRLERARA
jgi:hypothetical protein